MKLVYRVLDSEGMTDIGEPQHGTVLSGIELVYPGNVSTVQRTNHYAFPTSETREVYILCENKL